MKTMVCMPCMDTIPVETVRSLIRMLPKGEVITEFTECSLIYHARNQLAEKAVKENTDWTLWIDSDMVFPPDLLIDMMAATEGGKDIVSAVCHMRRPPYRPCIYKVLRQGLTPDENVSEPYEDYPRGAAFRIEACGFGCVLVRTAVLKAVIDKYHQAFSPLPGYGEDVSFCLRARGCGFDLWCDPAIQVGHRATTIVTDATFQAFRKAGGNG